MSISVKEDAGLDAEALRKEVSNKYREVATDPAGSFHEPIDDYWLKLMEPVIEKQLREKSVYRYDGKDVAREDIRCAA